MPIAALLSWPVKLYAGILEVELEQNITGYDCYFSKDLTSTMHLQYHGGFIFVAYLLLVIIVVTMYVLIGKKLSKSIKQTFRATFRRRTSKRVGQGKHKDWIEMKCQENETGQQILNNSDKNAANKNLDNGLLIKHKNVRLTNQSSNTQNMNKSRDEIASKKKNAKKKFTRISIAVTSLFIGSYLPLFILMAAAVIEKNSSPDKKVTLADWVPPIVWRLMFINNIGNPIIYLGFDITYRNMMKEYFLKCVQLRCFQRQKYNF